MKNRKHVLSTVQVTFIGCGAALLALACSGSDGEREPAGEAEAEPAPVEVDRRPAGETCEDNPLLVGCEREAPPEPGPQPAPTPDAPPSTPASASCPQQLIGFDDVYEAVANDLAQLDAADALTARYISVTNRATAGVCIANSLDTDRDAASKLVNMLSTATTVEPPVPIDPERSIFRIDLSDYNWDVAVTVVNADGTTADFTDKWEAIVANNPYAVPFVGDQADDAALDSGTRVPVMLADSMLDTAAVGNLYYALIDVDVLDTLDNFILNDLQVDVAQNLLDEDQVRAGTTLSRVSRQDRLIERDELEIRQGVLWQSFDFEANVVNESIFDDPFGFAEGGTEAIFTLPNGLFGFIIADENSAIVEDSDILLDTTQNDSRAITSISCSNCHAQGLLPVVDEVREVALANAVESGLDNAEVEQLEAVYPLAPELAGIIEADSARFQSALAAANLPVEGRDPVASVFSRFDQDMTLADAAGDLGLRPDQLERDLPLLDPTLQVLEDIVLDRDDFTQVYVASLCILSAANENTPDPVMCDALLLQ